MHTFSAPGPGAHRGPPSGLQWDRRRGCGPRSRREATATITIAVEGGAPLPPGWERQVGHTHPPPHPPPPPPPPPSPPPVGAGHHSAAAGRTAGSGWGRRPGLRRVGDRGRGHALAGRHAGVGVHPGDRAARRGSGWRRAGGAIALPRAGRRGPARGQPRLPLARRGPARVGRSGRAPDQRRPPHRSAASEAGLWGRLRPPEGRGHRRQSQAEAVRVLQLPGGEGGGQEAEAGDARCEAGHRSGGGRG